MRVEVFIPTERSARKGMRSGWIIESFLRRKMSAPSSRATLLCAIDRRIATDGLVIAIDGHDNPRNNQPLRNSSPRNKLKMGSRKRTPAIENGAWWQRGEGIEWVAPSRKLGGMFTFAVNVYVAYCYEYMKLGSKWANYPLFQIISDICQPHDTAMLRYQ